MLKPKHTFQSVVAELIDGLESGAVTIEPATGQVVEDHDHHAPAAGHVRDGGKPAEGLRIEEPEKHSPPE